MLAIKFHYRTSWHRAELPLSASFDEVLQKAKRLLNVEGPFTLTVPAGNETVSILSNHQWQDVIKTNFPGLIHLSVCTAPIAKPVKPARKTLLLAPGRNASLPIGDRGISFNQSINFYGRIQSMEDENICWNIDLYSSNTTSENILLRIEFQRNANDVGTTKVYSSENGTLVAKGQEFVSVFPFAPEQPFFISLIPDFDNRMSIRFTEERANIKGIPLAPFGLSDIGKVILTASEGRVFLESVSVACELL
jgi:hypothetical protein